MGEEKRCSGVEDEIGEEWGKCLNSEVARFLLKSVIFCSLSIFTVDHRCEVGRFVRGEKKHPSILLEIFLSTVSESV